MAMIVSVHSFRGGTGKSNITANVAALLARGGKRVGVVDTDIQSPGIHVLFGVDPNAVDKALNDYLWGRCTIEETAYDVSGVLGEGEEGRIYLIPSSIRLGEITHVLKEGYDVERLNEGFEALFDALDLDYLFIDTHPGINEETLLSVSISDVMIIVLRPDQQDFQGTAVTVDISRRLKVPELFLVVNMAPSTYDHRALGERIGETYACPVVAVLPLAEEVAGAASEEIFALQQPTHRFSKGMLKIVAAVEAVE